MMMMLMRVETFSQTVSLARMLTWPILMMSIIVQIVMGNIRLWQGHAEKIMMPILADNESLIVMNGS